MAPPESQRPGRVALIEQLRADGVRFVFGNPGTVEQGFLDALSGFADIEYVLTLQESVAVAMADGYARATRRPTVVQLHSGVGLGNGIGMLYQAKRGHSPLVVVAGEAGLRYDAMDAQMAVNLVEMARPVTKYATRVVDSGSVLRVLRRAVKIAATPPMGPVFVSLPMDVLDAGNDEKACPTTRLVTRMAPEAAEIQRVSALLADATAPMIIAGDGVAASGAEPELTRVAELLGAQVWGADWSEANMDHGHPLFGGQLGHMFGQHSQAITTCADAVLIVGTYVFPEVFPALSGVFAPNAPVVHVDLDDYEIAKNFGVDVGLVADPKLTLAALAADLEQTLSGARRALADDRMAQLGEAKARQLAAERAHDDSVRAAADGGVHAADFAAELARQLPTGTIVFDEALTTSPAIGRYLIPQEPGTFYQTRGGSLGVGIPGAMGIKLAHPDRTVVAFTGDGGAMYTIQALWTAVRHGIDAKFVVCNNGNYQLLKDNLEQYWDERRIAAHAFPTAFDISGPPLRFDKIAESMDVPACRVERADQVQAAIRAALDCDGPYLIDLVLEGAQ